MPKSIYFASDFHLGLDKNGTSRAREDRIINWLDSIIDDTSQLYLLGDLFDYWFEYDKVVPKGFIRFLAKLSEFTARDIPLHIFTGNHDMWMFDYLETEIGANIYREPISVKLHNHHFVLGHGDGLGPGDHGYKFIKRVFRNPINKWLFARIHPNLGIRIMKYYSQKSRESEETSPPFMGPEKEWLIQHCEAEIKTNPEIDYFIYGHRHLPIDYTLSNNKTRYINTGDWLNHNTYVKYDGQSVQLKTYES